MKKIIYFVLFLIVGIVATIIFLNNKKIDQDNNVAKPNIGASNLKIVATIFPVYDVVKQIAKDGDSISMILPPGQEAHHYEMKPSDLNKLQDANLILALRPDLDGLWLKAEKQDNEYYVSVANSKKKVIFIGDKIGQNDPHIWNNFLYLGNLVSAALSAIESINDDPIYKENAKQYKDEIYKVHYAFGDMIKKCQDPEIFFAGHNAFSYWEKYYGLRINALQGFLPEAQSSVFDMADFISKMNRAKAKHLYFDPLEEQDEAQTIAQETNAILVPLSPGHNISKNDFEKGMTLLDLLNKNINNIAKSLSCQP